MIKLKTTPVIFDNNGNKNVMKLNKEKKIHTSLNGIIMLIKLFSVTNSAAICKVL